VSDADCPKCGSDNPEAARFCRRCGEKMSGAPAPAAASNALRLAGTTEVEAFGVTGMRFRPDGKTLATTSLQGGIRFWNAGDLSPAGDFPVKGTTSLAFSPDGKRIAVGDWSGRVFILDASTGARIAKLSRWFGKTVRSLAFHPEGDLLASGEKEGKVFLWNTASRKKIGRIAQKTFMGKGLAFSPDGSVVVVRGWMDRASILKVPGGEELRVVSGDMEEEKSSFTAIAFHPDGKSLLSAGEGTIRLWDFRSGEETRTIVKDSYEFASVTADPGGSMLAAGTEDGEVTLWDFADGTKLAVQAAHKSDVDTVVFSPDGALLASGGYMDKKVKLWTVR
jgi:WD40 repeat protein